MSRLSGDGGIALFEYIFSLIFFFLCHFFFLVTLHVIFLSILNFLSSLAVERCFLPFEALLQCFQVSEVLLVLLSQWN